MNPVPFTTIDLALGLAFQVGLNGTLNSVFATIAGPLTALVVLWIIVQGILVMRGEIDMRKGLGKIVKHAFVIALVTSAVTYKEYVEQTFIQIIPALVKNIGGGPAAFIGIPASLDAMLAAFMVALHTIAAEIGPTDAVNADSLNTAQTVLFGTLWTTFGFYEVSLLMTEILVAIGPLLLIGYLFEFTKGVAERWVGQLINYAILLLLFHIVATIVVAAEFAYVSAHLVVLVAAGPTAAKIMGLYEMEWLLATGDLLIVTLPTVAAVLGGGIIGPNPPVVGGGQGPLRRRIAQSSVVVS